MAVIFHSSPAAAVSTSGVAIVALSQTTSTTGTSTTALTAFSAGGAGVKNYVTSLIVFNDSATDSYIQLQDGSGGTVFATVPAPAHGGTAMSFPTALPQPTANTALFFVAGDAVATMFVTAVGYQA